MNFAYATVLFFSMSVGVLAANAPPIECYQCNSSLEGQEDCVDLLDKNPATMLRPKLCNEDTHREQQFCRKTTLIVYHSSGDAERRTYRGCGSIRHENPCYRSANADHTEVTCQCFENGCNSGLHGASVSNLNMAITLLLVFFVSYYCI